MQRYIVTENLWARPGIRFVNYLIDFVAQYALLFILVMAIVLIEQMAGGEAMAIWFSSMDWFEEYLVGAVMILIYYTSMEAFFGQTIGKFATGTIVVDEDGMRPGTGAILKRSLCRLIPLEHFTFLGSGRGWHDSIPDTYVVRKKDLKEAMQLHRDFESMGQGDTAE